MGFTPHGAAQALQGLLRGSEHSSKRSKGGTSGGEAAAPTAAAAAEAAAAPAASISQQRSPGGGSEKGGSVMTQGSRPCHSRPVTPGHELGICVMSLALAVTLPASLAQQCKARSSVQKQEPSPSRQTPGQSHQRSRHHASARGVPHARRQACQRPLQTRWTPDQLKGARAVEARPHFCQRGGPPAPRGDARRRRRGRTVVGHPPRCHGHAAAVPRQWRAL